MVKFNLVALLQRLFSSPSYEYHIEQFIISRRPTNAAEVENLIREYQFRQRREWL